MVENVFILSTGRCGSNTFYRACGHITNYTSGHETRAHLFGPERTAYPPRHIESDNRLSWLLGRLGRAYGDRAAYVHLRRDRRATAKSHALWIEKGIMTAYSPGIIILPHKGEALRKWRKANARRIAADYCDTVDANIEAFLRDKAHKMTFNLEDAEAQFPLFWDMVGAAGDMAAAIREFDNRYNASNHKLRPPARRGGM